jgi:hypothetical protein
MIYIVLGMHKSGTTLVSQTLHRSGIDMGDGFEEGGSYDAGNQWERREAFLVNLDLMGCAERDYYSLEHYKEPQGELPKAQESAMKEMVERCEALGEDWGFKEPLTCLTYPMWKQVLPPHKIVAVYRSPLEVMNHYRTPIRRPDRAWRVLRAWSNYNQGMINAVRAEGTEALVIRYEELMRGQDDFGRLQSFVGRDLADARIPGQHRAVPQNPLFAPLDRLIGITSAHRPSEIFRRLESMRLKGCRIDAGSK